jgi:hypothetical protein
MGHIKLGSSITVQDFKRNIASSDIEDGSAIQMIPTSIPITTKRKKKRIISSSCRKQWLNMSITFLEI